MSKAKTRQAAVKRFKITGGKKDRILMHGHARNNHLRTKQTERRKRRKSLWVPVEHSDQKKLQKMIPGVSYGTRKTG